MRLGGSYRNPTFDGKPVRVLFRTSRLIDFLGGLIARDAILELSSGRRLIAHAMDSITHRRWAGWIWVSGHQGEGWGSKKKLSKDDRKFIKAL
jgi:hypothetical protein